MYFRNAVACVAENKCINLNLQLLLIIMSHKFNQSK